MKLNQQLVTQINAVAIIILFQISTVNSVVLSGVMINGQVSGYYNLFWNIVGLISPILAIGLIAFVLIISISRKFKSEGNKKLFLLFAVFALSFVITPRTVHAASQTNYLTNVVTGLATTYWNMSTSPPATADTTTSVRNARNTGKFIVQPGTATSTTTGNPDSGTPFGKGWATSYPLTYNIPAGYWTFLTKTTSSSATGTASLVYEVYANCSGTNTRLFGVTNSTNILTSTSAITINTTVNEPGFSTTGCYIKVEYWINVTTAGGSNNGRITFTVNDGGEYVIWPTPNFYTTSSNQPISFSSFTNQQYLYSRNFYQAINSGFLQSNNYFYLRNVNTFLTTSLSQTANALHIQNIFQNFVLNNAVSNLFAYSRSLNQAVSLKSLTAQLFAYTRNLFQSISATIVGTKASAALTFVENVFQQISLQNTMVTLFRYTRISNQAFNLLTISSRVAIFTKSLSQSINLSNLATKITFATRSLAQSISFATSAIKLSSFARYLNQALGLSSFLTKTSAFTRTLIQPFNTFQSLSTVSNFSRNLLQSVSLSNVATRVSVILKTLSQSFSLTNSISKTFSAVRLAIQSSSFGSFVSNIFAYTRNLMQAITLKGFANSLSAYARTFAQSISISNFATKGSTFVRNLYQSVSLNSITGQLFVYARSFSQSISLANLSTRLALFSRSLSQSISVFNSVSNLFAYARNFIQSMSLTSATTRILGAVRNLNQSFTFSSFATGAFSIGRFVTQSLKLNMVTSQLSAYTRNLVQSISANNFATRLAFISKSLAQSINLSGFSIRTLLTTLNIEQQISLTAAATRLAGFTKSFVQSISVSNIPSKILTASRNLFQTISLASFMSKSYATAISLMQAIKFNTITTELSSVTKFVNQSINFRTATSSMFAYTRTFAQQFMVNTVAKTLGAFTRTLQQFFNVSQFVSRTGSLTASVVQSFKLSSVAQRLSVSIRNLIASFSVATTISSSASLFITNYQNFAVKSFLQSTSTFARGILQAISLHTLTTRQQALLRLFNANLSFNISSVTARLYTVTVSQIIQFLTNLFSQFTQGQVQQPAPPFSGGGGSPIFAPTTTATEFVESPILRETIPGYTVVHTINVEDKLNYPVSGLHIDVSGVPSSWVKVSPQNLTLQPGEKSSFILSINVPDDAPAGDYQVQVKLQNSALQDTTFFVLRVKQPNPDQPIVSREVIVNKNVGQTIVNLQVTSPKTYPSVEIVEQVPKSLANSTKYIDFVTPPTQIIQSDPSFAWILTNVTAGSQTTLSYILRTIPSDLSPLIYFPVQQVAAIADVLATGFTIVSFNLPVFYQGSNSTVEVVVKNTDTRQHNLTATINVPANWTVVPNEIHMIINASQQQKIKFNVAVPSDAKTGSYILDVLYSWDGSVYAREYQIIVYPAWNASYYVIIVVATITIIAIALWLLRKRSFRSENAKLAMINRTLKGGSHIEQTKDIENEILREIRIKLKERIKNQERYRA